MTAYTVSGSVSPGAPGTGSYIVVRAAVFQMRVAKIEVNSVYGYLYRITSASQSGGSALTPLAMREGSPASAAGCWQNSSSVSGSSTYIGVANAYQPPFSLILNPGSAIAVYGYNGTGTGGGAGTITATFYWEELRLSWSY